MAKAKVVTKGGFTSVKIPNGFIKKRIALYAHSLIGRLILQKGDNPYKLTDLKNTLTKIWGIKESWCLISLGRGYYNILLGTQETKQKV